MHTLMVLAAGFVIFGFCAIAGRFIGGTAGIAASGLVFLPIWFIGAAINMYLGVKKAGYSIAGDAPMFLVVFSLPAAAALFTWWKLR